MSDLSTDVKLAVELAARDVAKVMSDRHGSDFVRVRRNLVALINIALAGSNEEGWLPLKDTDPWLRGAAAPGLVDKEVLSRAISKWWDSLDASKQLDVIMGPAGHHKSEYINSLLQKYQDKPETTLQSEIPELQKAYRAEMGSGHSPEPASEEAPVASSLKVAAGGDVRYDSNAWVQVWVTAADMEGPELDAIRASAESEEQKIAKAQDVAKRLAGETVMMAQVKGVKINVDSLDMATDRMDWSSLVSARES